jgi:hypothetical protein
MLEPAGRPTTGTTRAATTRWRGRDDLGRSTAPPTRPKSPVPQMHNVAPEAVMAWFNRIWHTVRFALIVFRDPTPSPSVSADESGSSDFSGE